MISRRTWMRRLAMVAGGGLLGPQVSALAQSHEGHAHSQPPAPKASLPKTTPKTTPKTSAQAAPALRSPVPYNPVVTPDGWTLPFRMKDGVKEFHLLAEPCEREFAPGMTVRCWGYNGTTPGPTIEAVEGDRVRIFVSNRLPEGTSVHWHGILLPNGMDGVSGLLQPVIPPGETYVYEFTLRQHGTYMYHPHADEMVQMAVGMMGFFVIHPREPKEDERVDRDYCLFPHMWSIAPGTSRPNPNVMLDFNIFTLNGRVYPGTTPMLAKLGDRVRFRFGNISMTSHPMHFHGHRFWVSETDGGRIPRSARWPETTIDVPTGTTRAVEFVADNPGDWPLHCHKTHHAMNAMSHDIPNVLGADQDGVAKDISRLVSGYTAMGSTGMAEHSMHAGHHPSLPNTLPMMTGEGPFGMIDMGGMFTMLKIRENLASYDIDPGWFDHPRGTVAWKTEDTAAIPPLAMAPKR